MEKSEGISPEYMWQKSISGRGHSMYKGPEVGACLRNSKEDGVTRKKRGVMGVENWGCWCALEASRIMVETLDVTLIRTGRHWRVLSGEIR